jgi:site-specific recombinase XerD
MSTVSYPAIRPLEMLAIPVGLMGVTGTNRAVPGTRAQIDVTNDIDAVKVWLARFADTKTTFDNYRKEAERLLLWATLQLGKPLSSLSHEDFLAYKAFLADPQPAVRWVIDGRRRLARNDPRWRPFAGPLAASSQRQAMVILNSLFSWLVSAGYLAGNPLSLSRQRARKSSKRIVRFLDEKSWNAVKQSITSMPQETNRERFHAARVRWLFSLFYIAGLRITEVVENTMGAFFSRPDNTGTLRWWLEVTGKGDKTRIVPATNELMAELARYRVAAGLAALPTQDEITPLLLPVGNRHRSLTRAAVHQILKDTFRAAADQARARGETEEAVRLDKASAHWLRHTAASSMANQSVDLTMVRDNLGHESIATTSIYLHTADDARHQQTEDKHRLGW